MYRTITVEEVERRHSRWHKKNRKLLVKQGDTVFLRIYFNKGRFEAMWFRIVFAGEDNQEFVATLITKPAVIQMQLGEELQFERFEIIDHKRNSPSINLI